MNPKEKFISIVANQPTEKADAIVILEGDALNRIPHGAELYKEGWAPLVVLSGGIDNPPHSIPSRRMLPHLVAAGVPEASVVIEEKSQHTWGQVGEIAALAKERGWKKIIIVASHYHQYRAYLTFLKGFTDAGLDKSVVLINSPARDLPWFDANDPQGRRADLLEGEFERIEKYYPQGNVASFEEGVNYLQWKESQQ
jgi:uncharacterized SAM-binding protein YcdF (DUF218 family)